MSQNDEKNSENEKEKDITRLDGIETKEERQKALHDILMKVKTNSYEYYKAQSGTDIDAMRKMIEGKKALQELAKTHIFLE